MDARFIQATGSSRSKDHVEIRMNMDFFGASTEATQHHAEFMREMRSMSWCSNYEEVTSKPFPDGGGLSYDNIRMDIDVALWIQERDAAQMKEQGS